MPASLVADTVTEEFLAEAGSVLVEEIERYLAGQRRTAHPLVSKTTAELVEEALGAARPAAPVAAPVLSVPGRVARVLPDWLLPVFRQAHGAGRGVSVAEHLELTALLIERHGWAQGRLRSPGGARCLLGAQRVLVRLGYGDEATARAAGRRVQAVLTARGITQDYYEWNDHPDRTAGEVLYLLRQAADGARS
ncbi:DUF6197 family protein [Streptomyces albireticuli]|uniref:Uncharacterized protein n=1 Tax=Streptomyces albireticuli TaxID=1940 RepID=A0A2A2D534_9ACTN|nr:hypothetical protein [Streptomyces albireticuli]MCD9196054.1 hypothetical protein [Streptomyces albireticuli]PAU46556.1 hypothetical protein CK936_23470 [Streptomyces albireticuli]